MGSETDEFSISSASYIYTNSSGQNFGPNEGNRPEFPGRM
jgi:hypothetical protein